MHLQTQIHDEPRLQPLPQLQETPSTLPIEDLDDFVRALVGWHEAQVTKVQHLQQVPEGAVFQVGDDTEIVMTKEVLAGFQLGIELVMALLGTLPFLVEVEDDEIETQDATN